MKLKTLASNMTELVTSKAVILFSYQTPVAACLNTGGFLRTDTKYSVTTTKHINKWLAGANAKEVSQEVIDDLAG